MKVGDVVNGCELLAIWGETATVYVFKCGLCGSEFSRTAAKVRYWPVKSCGCGRRAAHDRVMGRCFAEARKRLAKCGQES